MLFVGCFCVVQTGIAPKFVCRLSLLQRTKQQKEESCLPAYALAEIQPLNPKPQHLPTNLPFPLK